MRPYAPPTWICTRCLKSSMLDRPAEMCGACEAIVCVECYDRDLDRCDPCADQHRLSDGELLAVICEWPGLVQIDLAERARTKALLARFNQRDLPRIVQSARWYANRVDELLPGLHHDGSIACNHGHRRETDHSALCEWTVTPSGLRELRLLSGAA